MSLKNMTFSKSGSIGIEYEEGPEFDRVNKLALDILGECRKSVMLAMRFLNIALWHMPFECRPMHRPLSTNGNKLFYDPEEVISRYEADPNEMIRDYMHAILHCIFHHPFDKRHFDRSAWALACDISLEVSIIEMCGLRFPSGLDIKRMDEAEKLAVIAGHLTAPALYKIFEMAEAGVDSYARYGLTLDDVLDLQTLFVRDLHDDWARMNDEQERQQNPYQSEEGVPDIQRPDGVDDSADDGVPSTEEGESLPMPSDSDSDSDSDAESESDAPDEDNESSLGGDSGSSDNDDDDSLEDAEEEWENISKTIEADLQSFSQGAGSDNGSMMTNLQIANRRPANYEEFLRRFATMGEDMRINDDEFDYIFYTFGLDTYGNMPLVEPLEYKESNRVREFVIAIDTSGSCSGELVKTFVNRTYDVMRQSTSFGDDVNVHIIQCDMEIQSDTKITSIEEMEEFCDNFMIKGYGGTDFRPLFNYVDRMVEMGEFENLRGLIYFTDGLGTFPPKGPDYETAFVFVDDTGAMRSVPPWAMKVVMTQDEVMDTGR